MRASSGERDRLILGSGQRGAILEEENGLAHLRPSRLHKLVGAFFKGVKNAKNANGSRSLTGANCKAPWPLCNRRASTILLRSSVRHWLHRGKSWGGRGPSSGAQRRAVCP